MAADTPILPSIQPDEAASSIDIVEAIAVIWKQRKLIAYFVGACTVLSIIVSLLLPAFYRSAATVLPDGDKSRTSSFGGLSDLASLAGLPMGDASFAKLFPAMMRSESILSEVLQKKYQTKQFDHPVNLIEFWGITGDSPEAAYEATLIKLREELEVNTEPRTGLITLSIATNDAIVSAEILNAIMKELDRYVRTKRVTNANNQRRWIEQRLIEVKGDLDTSEYKLRDFREKNRKVLDSPNLLLEEARLGREVQISTTLYIELKKQYELVKIEEVKNLPVVNVLDSARPATERERPRRRRIVVGSFLAGLVLAVGYVLIKWKYETRIMQVVKTLTSRRDAQVEPRGQE